ncbi:MAG: NAD(P)H-dependent oxidoreductase subunit E [Cyanobium sp.]|jgi:bidirectional [NiFe] hydrogenase diaphorase subunit
MLDRSSSSDLEACISRLVRLQAGRQDALIEVLHAVQQQQGHLSPAALGQVARQLRLPLSRVYGVASFYHLFQLQPPTAHRCGVCLGTACFVRGAAPLLERLVQLLGLAPDQSGADGVWRLERLSCMGACGQAPLLLIDDQVLAELPLADPSALDRRLRQALAEAANAGADAALPNRG